MVFVELERHFQIADLLDQHGSIRIGRATCWQIHALELADTNLITEIRDLVDEAPLELAPTSIHAVELQRGDGWEIFLGLLFVRLMLVVNGRKCSRGICDGHGFLSPTQMVSATQLTRSQTRCGY